MPPKIIYKQRHRDPCRKGRPYTTTANAEHLKYIGTREGVLPTDETTSHLKYIGQRPGTLETGNAANGLFGYINGAFAPSTDMTAAQGYIRNISKQHDIFRCCFSFTPDSAAEAGLHALADWQRFVLASMNKIAKNMEIKIENIEWYAAVHLKEGQPHVHIMYWDKEQKIRRNKVDPKICDNIRIDVIKDTYHSQFVQLREKENHLTSALRTEVNSTANNAMLRNASDQNTEIVLQMLNSLYRKLPSKGRLAYAFMPQEIKEGLNRLTYFIINSSEQATPIYSELLHTRQIYNEMLHSSDTNWGRYNLAKYKDKLCEDIEQQMGNVILKALSKEKKQNKTILDNDMFNSESYELPSQPDEPQTEETTPPTEKRYYIRWSKDFKAARAAAQGQDIGKALRLYKSEVSKGNVLAIYEIADIFHRGLATSTEEKIFALFSNALERFMQVETTATTMKPYLQYRIGRMLYDGYGTKTDMETALKWLEQAANGSNHNAQYTVGKMYRDGTGTAPNMENAILYISRAAESGNVYAKAALARLYLCSDEHSRHYQAETILNQLIKQSTGEQKSYFESILGAAYYYSDTLRDTAKAKELLERAAQNGSEYAAVLLSRIAEHERNAVNSLLCTLMALLNSAEHYSNVDLQNASKLLFGRGDLSKEMIAELIYKRQDKENTSQR
jgi:TPR repeat protein